MCVIENQLVQLWN